MRLRLFRRRLASSAHRVSVRSAMPWPLRWLLAAMVLGFSAALALWAFEFGKSLAGLERDAQRELQSLRTEVIQLRAERDRVTSVATTSESLLTAEKTAMERLATQVRQLETENRTLRDELGFFENLLPTGGRDGVAIRGLQAEVLAGSQVKWQVLVIQPDRNAPEFSGALELTLNGTQQGKPWVMALPGGPQQLQFKRLHRLEGIVELPPQTVVKNLSAKVTEGSATRSVQTISL